jgi:hypothetical protein
MATSASSHPWAFQPREQHEEVDAFLLPAIRPLLSEVLGTAHRKVCARREGNHHVPRLAEDVAHVTLVMWPRRIGRQDVARGGIMAQGQ